MAFGLSSSSVKDHLHIRGEYLLKKVLDLIEIGSPPHTWRILFIGVIDPPFVGITSTYVENTKCRSANGTYR